jgi:hypothetical protein
MCRPGLVLGIVVVTMGAFGSARPAKDMKELTFLTREGCVNTPDMRLNLDDALIQLGWRRNYEEINLGTLPKTDARTGYPTPTVLWKGRDIFGLPAPKPPYASPT